MKLILTAEVAGLGAPGDIVEVTRRLRPQLPRAPGRGDRWTKGAEKQIAQIKRAATAREIRDLDHANEIKQRSWRRSGRADRPRRRRRQAVRLGHPGRRRRRGQGRRRPGVDKRRIERRRPHQDRRRAHRAVELHPGVTAELVVRVTAG